MTRIFWFLAKDIVPCILPFPMADNDALGDSRLLYDDCSDLDEPEFIVYGDDIKLWVAPKVGAKIWTESKR